MNTILRACEIFPLCVLVLSLVGLVADWLRSR